jgi:hypothetical protein
MPLSSVLPKEHLSENAKDVIKVTMAMLATLAALVLGLLTASAKSSLDDKENAVRSWPAEALLLDRTLAQYGPEAQGARELLKQAIAARIAQLWPGSGEAVTPAKIGEGAGIEGVQQALLALTPKTDAQRWLQSTALQTTNTIAARRWLIAQQIASNLRWPFLVVLNLLACCHFCELRPVRAAQYYRGSRSFVAALSVAGSIFLILEMDQPYSGFIKIKSDPLRLPSLSDVRR